MFVLDTNVISELRRPDKADPKVTAWALSQPLSRCFLSAITLLELEIGALIVERKDRVQGLVLRSWIDHQVLPRFDGRILPVDTAFALRCARLHVPDPSAERDALVLASVTFQSFALAASTPARQSACNSMRTEIALAWVRETFCLA